MQEEMCVAARQTCLRAFLPYLFQSSFLSVLSAAGFG